MSKLLAPAAAKLATGQLLKRMLPRLVARKTIKAAKKHGLDIDTGRLRTWLRRPETTTLIIQHTEAGLADLQYSFAQEVLLNTDPPYLDVAAEALTLTLRELLTTMDLPLTIYTQNQMVLARQTEILEAVEDQRDPDKLLDRIPTIFRTSASEYTVAYPPLATALAALSRSPDRPDLLRQWGRSSPKWLREAPGDVLTLIACLSETFDEREATRVFLKSALSAGCQPRGFWSAWGVMLDYSEDPDQARIELAKEPSTHPYWLALDAIWSDDPQLAVTLLEAWEPDTPFEAAHRGLLLGQLHSRLENLNLAISVFVETAKETGSTGAARLAAQSLLWRGARSLTTNRLADTRRALGLALEARDSIRGWGGDSSSAVVLAAKAAHLSRSSERAWLITQATPEGEANQSEGAAPEVRREAALAGALTGRFDQAREIAQGLAEPFLEAMVEGYIAEFNGRPHDAETQYRRAFELTQEPTQKLMAMSGLAELGAELPATEHLDGYDEPLAEVRALAKAMQSADPIAGLRIDRHRNPIFAVKLAEELSRSGDLKEAGEALLDASHHFSDPNMALMAAERLRRAEELSEARSAVELSLTLGGLNWTGAAEAQIFLVELSWQQRHWDAAVQAARSLVQLDENDPRFTWALVRSYVQRGDLEHAWQALTSTGKALEPRNEDDAGAWVNLLARFSLDDSWVSDAIHLMRRWPDDEQLLATFLQAFHAAPRPDQATINDERGAQIQAATQDFITRFPESKYLRSVDLGPEDNPLRPLEAVLKSRYTAVSELSAQVRNAELPLGALCSILGGTYTSSSLRRGGGMVIAFNHALQDIEGEAAVNAFSAPHVGVDQTAFHTLAILEPALRGKLIGSFVSVISTDQAFRDAVEARDELSQQSTMSISWHPDSDRPQVIETSIADAERLASLAHQIVSMMRGIRRYPRPELRQTQPDRQLTNSLPWLSVVDICAENGWPFWSDDLVQRHLARQLGVQTFSSQNVVDALLGRSLTESDRAYFQAELLRSYYAYIPFDTVAYELAAAIEGWSPTGVATSLTKSENWTNPADVANFCLKAIRQASARDDGAIRGWAFAATVGLSNLTNDDQDARRNVVLFLRNLLASSWMQPSHVSSALAGVRQAIASSNEKSTWEDPLLDAIRLQLPQWVAEVGFDLTATLLMNLVSACSESDKASVARELITNNT